MNDRSELIRQTLDELFKWLDRPAYSCVRGLPNETGGAVHNFVSSAEEAAQAVENFCFGERRDVNFCIGLVNEPLDAGMKAKDVAGIWGFFLDIDFQHEDSSGKRYPLTIDDAIECLPLEPPLLICSGHGIHAAYLFPEPYFFEGKSEEAIKEDKWNIEQISRKLMQAAKNRAAWRGWVLDSTPDLTRGFRLPGTINYKSGETDVYLIRRNDDLRRDAKEISSIISDDVSSYDPTVGKPPRIYGEALWRDDPAYRGLIITAVRGELLDPEKLREFLSDEKIRGVYNRSCKPRTTRKAKVKRASTHGDTSGRDYKLAIEAAKSKLQFSNQEIADLLIGCRAENNNDLKLKWPSYYPLTIWKAREALRGEEPLPPIEEIMGEDGEEPPPHEGREQDKEDIRDNADAIASLPPRLQQLIPAESAAKQDLTKRLRVTKKLSEFLKVKDADLIAPALLLVLKIEDEIPRFNFYFSDGRSANDLEEARMAEVKTLVWGFHLSGYYIHPPSTQDARRWLDEFRQLLFFSEIRVPPDPSITKGGELAEYVNGFCNDVRRIAFKREDLVGWANALLIDRDKNNDVWIPALGFLQWLRRSYGVSWSENKFSTLAKSLGYKKERFRGKISRTMYLIPSDVVDIVDVVESYNARMKVDPNSIAREEEDERERVQ